MGGKEDTKERKRNPYLSQGTPSVSVPSTHPPGVPDRTFLRTFRRPYATSEPRAGEKHSSRRRVEGKEGGFLTSQTGLRHWTCVPTPTRPSLTGPDLSHTGRRLVTPCFFKIYFLVFYERRKTLLPSKLKYSL